MLQKESLGVASLSVGNIGVTGLCVVDDVLLQHFDFRHAQLGRFHLGGQGVVLRCDGGSSFFQNASVQQIVFLQIDQRLGKLFQIEVLRPPCVTGTLSLLQLCLNVNQQKKKAEMDAKKALIRAEDMKKGVFSTIGQLPKEEPRKGSIAASAAV